MITIHVPNKRDCSLPTPALPCNVLSLLQDAGMPISAPCGGNGRCGNCRVRIFGDLSAPDTKEQHLLGKEALADGMRLACRARLIGENAEIFLERSADMHAPDTAADTLQPVRPLGTRLGLVIDLGTTTIAGALYDLKNGALLAAKTIQNPQAAFGADVISRLQAARSNAKALSDTAMHAIRDLTRALLKAADRGDLPDAAVLTANTAMLCLLFGYPVRSLIRAPFALPHVFGETRPLSELLPNAEGTLLIPPCIGPFLGADIVTALLDTNLCHRTRPTALLDLGTNGEIALFDGKTLTCCSTAAGPAFEGAGIRMGCGAVTGAINRVTLQDGKLHCHTLGDIPATGLCGSGLLDAIACLLDAGKLKPDGRLIGGEGVQLGDTDVSLYQQDVRAFQSAKAAIRAGLDTLCVAANTQTPDLLLAGGFGSTLNTASAARAGLIPKDATNRTHAVGNAALQGAAKLLTDSDLLSECHRIAANAKLLDLAKNPAFTERYIEQMGF